MRIELEDVQDGVLVGPQGSVGEVRGTDVFGVLAGATEAARRAAFETVLVAAREMGCTTTVGLTAPGLRRLGVQAALVDVLSPEFLAGAKDRTRLLDDPPPSHWQPELAVDWDVVVMLSRPGTSSVPLPATAGFDRVWEQATVLNKTRTEPFGFADARSNPVLEGSGRRVTPGNGVWDGSGWRPLRAGEVLFGYPNEDGAFPGSTMSQGLLRNGSFLVWRKIEQNLTAFNELAGLIAAKGVPAEEARALIIGRKQDGDPLIGADNDFSFTEGDEWRVPRASHIRRANPRGTYGFSPSSVTSGGTGPG